MTDSDDGATRGGTTDTELTHAALRDLLADYATAVALGGAPQTAYPDLAGHLEGCAECRATLRDLLELTVDAYEGRVAPALSYPHPDLAFLPAETGTAETPHRQHEPTGYRGPGSRALYPLQGQRDRGRAGVVAAVVSLLPVQPRGIPTALPQAQQRRDDVQHD